MSQKVLIVEDDSNIAELLHLYLEKEGFETKVAKDGGKGVEYFRSFQPNLVLLDIMLPIMDGWTVLKKIREESAAPVIMLTAKGETEDKVTGLEGGADRLHCQALRDEGGPGPHPRGAPPHRPGGGAGRSEAVL